MLGFALAGLVLSVIPLPAPLQPRASIASDGGSRPVQIALAALERPTWIGSYDGGTLAQFQSTTWNNLPLAPSVVRTAAVDGHFAGRYVIPARGSRCESVPKVGEFGEGDSIWFSWATRLGGDFPLGTDRWQVVDQWKNDGIGSPPLELKITSGRFVLDGGYGWPGNTDSPHSRLAARDAGRATRGAWDRWTMRVNFSSSSRIGYASLWRNGRRLFRGWHLPGGTLYPHERSYLKVGYYRDPEIAARGTVFQDRIRVGRTAGAVA